MNGKKYTDVSGLFSVPRGTLQVPFLAPHDVSNLSTGIEIDTSKHDSGLLEVSNIDHSY